MKTKRKAIKSLKDRLRNKFNVSVSEVDNHDKWQIADIAVANVTTDKAHANSILSKILNFIDDFNDVDIIDHQVELF